MTMLTYKQAFDKITEAYIKEEIEPYDPKFCFCGNLCNNTSDWFIPMACGTHYASHGYSGRELFMMERALLTPLPARDDDPLYEDALFEGMCAALDVLKSIHESRGDIIDETPAFTKRQLQTV